MHVHAYALIALLCVGPLEACATNGRQAFAAPACAVNETCTLQGRLTVFRGVPASVAELRTAGGCYAVALSEADYRKYQRKVAHVRISGPAYHGGFAEGVVSLRIRDRQVATGICTSGLLIYAESVVPIP